MGQFDFQHAMANPDESLVPFFQGIYTESEESRGLVGTIRRLGPRTYVYAKNGGTALGIGMLAVQPTPAANHQNIAVASAAAINAEEVTVTLGATAATSNQYEDGFLFVTDATGEGTGYRIRSNPAADASASLVLTLYDKIHTALTTSSEVCLIPNPYNGVVIAVTDQADIPAGVPNIAVTASYYFWLQTGGPCAVLADEAVTQGEEVVAGTSVAGAVEAADAAGEPLVGTAIIALVDEEYRPVDLSILR
jgi:hypothetical protein